MAASVKRTVSKAALKIVKLEEIKVDPSYQRSVLPQHKKIEKEFLEEALGIPVLAEREGGELYVVDGLQRITALKGMGRTTVRAEVFASRGPEHEAEVFKIINKNRTRLTPLQLFNASLTAHDKEAWAVKTVVEAAGFEIPKETPGGGASMTSPKNAADPVRYIRAVQAVSHIYRHGKEKALQFVLGVVKEIWSDDVTKLRSEILMGLYSFWSRHKNDVNVERLLPRLASRKPADLLYSSSLGVGDRNSNMADVIEKLYRKTKVNNATTAKLGK